MQSSFKSLSRLWVGGVCLLLINGCALQKLQHKTFLDLRTETSNNYSQQVVDAIVGVREEASLPVFFSVEAGQSSWTPVVSSGISAVIPNLKSDLTTLSPSLNGSLSMNSSIQFNDFGSAPMSRVNTLYAILCFQYDIGSLTLPNGVLYTVVSEQEGSSGLLYARRTQSGTYLGVPEEKREEFLKFSKDVNFWTRHAVPDLNDLNSSAGMVYRFSIEYPQTVVSLSQNLRMRDGATAGLPAAQQALAAEKAAFDQLVEEAKTGSTPPEVMNTLLQFKREELQSKVQSVGAVGGQIEQAKQSIQSDLAKIENLISTLRDTLYKVKTYDPKAADLDVDGAIGEFNRQVAQVIEGDTELIQQFESTVLGGALQAQDSVDKLYRDRFEALPQRFSDAFQTVE